MKKIHIVCLLLILCLVFGMLAGCAGKSGGESEGTVDQSNSVAVDEGDIDDPFGD